MFHNFLIILIILVALVGIVTLGFVIPPRPYRKHPAPSHLGTPTPFRPNLPEPVRRHFSETIGESPPFLETAVVWGRGRACIRGVWVPFRFRAWYRVGDAFLRRMEVTWFRRPVLRGIDTWVNGQGLFAMGGREESGEQIDQGQVLALWADTLWFPSAYVHNAHILWEPIDDQSARLVFPFKDATDHLTAHFDSITGRMTHLNALRYSDESNEKEPWRVDLLEWKEFNEMLIPYHISIAWGESGSPWSYWMVDGIAYNVRVDEQLGERIVLRKHRRRKKEPVSPA